MFNKSRFFKSYAPMHKFCACYCIKFFRGTDMQNVGNLGTLLDKILTVLIPVQ